LARRSCPKNSQLSAAIMRDSPIWKNIKPRAPKNPVRAGRATAASVYFYLRCGRTRTRERRGSGPQDPWRPSRARAPMALARPAALRSGFQRSAVAVAMPWRPRFLKGRAGSIARRTQGQRMISDDVPGSCCDPVQRCVRQITAAPSAPVALCRTPGTDAAYLD